MLKDKIVFISGASSGLGEAMAKKFAKEGAVLLLCARNFKKLNLLKAELESKYGNMVYTYELDIRDRKAVDKVFDSIPSELRNINILINNAGLALGLEKVQEGSLDDFDEMIDTNVKGLLYLTRKVVPSMVENQRGHVINIGSIAGVQAYPNGAVYCATKAAVKFISDGLRMDLVHTPIKVTNIQPGMVETNFSVVRFHGDEERATKVYDGIKALSAEDIADVALYAATVPEHVQICEITVTPTHQASGTVIYKK
ncbi:SDR family NAD(P)-dependent oxidoreductase [Clostridium swellfunianum]|uniref:SDR family NAD(P)-dependent oxidoreductase n=1 Tax=Clostridium swellfunianum TaxID=1367462 RepID=UPI00202EBDE6|nr:SDR family NAD(P)-dependent oxidoreductase [Clostridium swellfunianum]MCM0650499.1 SDR family NAD(P)-dependent oxidoreductase [Clostridium swellfunianum]